MKCNKISIVLMFFIIFLPSCNTLNSQDNYIQIFEETWERVNDNYFDPNMSGIDWEAIKEKYKPMVENTQSDDEFFTNLNNMLFGLGSSHIGVGPISEAESASSPYMFKEGSVGIDIRIINGEVVISKVEAKSPAEMAGIKVGSVINKINNVSIDLIAKNSWFRPPHNQASRKLSMSEEILRNIYGQADTYVTLDYTDAMSKDQTIELKREMRSGAINQGSKMRIFLEVEDRSISPDIAYLRFNAFQPDNPVRILRALERIKGYKGLIIDLRGNNGGSVEALQRIIGHFTPVRFKCFTLQGRDTSEDYYIDPADNIFEGPVVILIDEMSVSGAENMANIMQEQKMATVIGVKTPGQLLWGEGSMLDEEIVLIVPIYQLFYPNGINPEGRGVIPDSLVTLSREDLLLGNDSQLEVA